MLKMSFILVLLALIFFLCLLVVTAVQPVRPIYSLAELQRRAKEFSSYKAELEKYKLYPALATLLRIKQAILLVIVTSLLLVIFGWFGLIISIALAATYPAIARQPVVKRHSLRYYKKVENKVINLANRFKPKLQKLRDGSVNLHQHPKKVDSLSDLNDVIENSKDVIGSNEQSFIAAALAFPNRKVGEIMTPKSAINYIKSSEFLGPLVLDELHALGHSRLPVVQGDLDSVIGVLHLRDMLSLDVKQSSTAQKAMEPKVFYVNEGDSLQFALAEFIKKRHHFFIVRNESGQTVGLITLQDVIAALVGNSIKS